MLWINGKRVSEKDAAHARPNQTMLSFLREIMGLTGSKLGCAEGGCGACTVMISKIDKESKQMKYVNSKILSYYCRRFDADTIDIRFLRRHFSVNACLMPVLAADGCHVTTVEGVGSVKGDNLHPVQQAMVDMHGSQCGFCTPGIIVSIYTLLSNSNSVKTVEEHLDGNLCRCTGYRPIWDAARSLCDDAADLVRGPCGTPCRECHERDECEQDCNVADKKSEEDICCTSSKDKVKIYQDTFLSDQSWKEKPNKMFPKELLDEGSSDCALLSRPLMVVDRSEHHSVGTWFKPTSLVELLALLKHFGGLGAGACKLVVGNTEVGIETRFKQANYPRLISPADSIRELFSISVTDNSLVIGACCPLSMIQHECEVLGADPSLTRTVMPVRDMLRWFASTQIRNVACLGGNLATASPISDMNPMLASMGATLTLSSLNEKDEMVRRKVKVSEFFLQYRTVDLKPTEVVECIEVPRLAPVFEYVKPFKQARRREDDISIVTAGMKIILAVKDSKLIIADAALAYGGMVRSISDTVDTQ